MAHTVSLSDFELDDIDEWLSGDDRTLAFVVKDGDGNTVDISAATVTWALYERAYNDDPDDAVINQDAGTVDVVTDSRVDTADGEFEIRIDGDATADKYGEYWYRPVVEMSDGTRASWRGRIELTA